MASYDVIFGHNSFTLTTTVEAPDSADENTIEEYALKQLAEEYGLCFADVVKSSSGITIEGMDEEDEYDEDEEDD